MCKLGSILLSCSIVAWTAPLVAYGQDAQSLGDVARQARQQKQQKDGADTSPPKAARVLTDDETPSQAGQPAQAPTSDHPTQPPGNSTASAVKKLSAEEWKAQILAQKNLINSTQDKIDKLKASIHYSAYGNVPWNDLQRQKLQHVERMEAQLNDQKKRLEEMQETAKRQGYGNSVYDP